MNTERIYRLASTLSEKDIDNILAYWDNKGEEKYINEFNSLVRLGDSISLSMGTVLENKYIEIEGADEIYKRAFES